MARIRCSGGIVLEGDHRVWLVADPGDEVLDSRRSPGAPVVVGRATAGRAEVDRARRDAQRLVARGGPIVAAAGVRIRAFRTARLECGAESRRDAVLAAVEVLGSRGLHRIGEPAAVLVALFGVRATKRVGAAALDGLALDQLSPLRLAVAASDLLGPEQLESVLALRAPPGTEPVPKGDAAMLGQQLASVLGPYTAKRRVELLRSLWDDVVGWQLSAIARGRARRRPTSPVAIERWQRKVRRLDSAWWQAQATTAHGGEPDALALATWVPSRDVWQAALVRTLHECGAATTLLRTALAAEERPVQAAVLAHLDALDHLARRDDHGAAGERAALLVATVALASGTAPSGGDRLGGRDVDALLATQLRDAWALAHATLTAALELGLALQRSPVAGEAQPLATPAVAEWRAVAGYGPARPPERWHFRLLAPTTVISLAARLSTEEPIRAADVEFLDDGLWIADLADALAAWYGHARAEINYGVHGVDVDPVDDEDDPRLPLLESVPLAVAGAAQLLAVGAVPPARPKTWEALVGALVAAAENLGLDEPFPMAAAVAATDRTVVPDTDLVVDVARTPRQLAEWGNHMGNCIAGYADDADRRYALVALRDAAGKLAVNLALQRETRRWFVSEAFARFNEDLPAELRARLDAWAGQIPVASPAAGGRGAARPRRTAPGGRRPPARDRLLRASARLGDEVGDLGAASDDVVAMAAALAPIARELGWAGDGDAALAGPVRRHRPAPATGDPRRRRRPRPRAGMPPGRAVAGDRHPTPRGGHRPRRRPRRRPPPAHRQHRPRRPTPRPPRPPGPGRANRRPGRPADAADPGRVAGGGRSPPRPGRGRAAPPRVPHRRRPRPHRPGRAGRAAVDWVPVAGDGSVPGRPRSSVRDERGPWAEARPAAIEMGVTGERLDEVVADAPGRHLLVPTAWTAAAGWTGLWARAHRTTRRLGASPVRRGPDRPLS